jgi:hypothetical protein
METESGQRLYFIPYYKAVVFDSVNNFPTNPHWTRVVGYGPFSLWLIHKEGLCRSSGDINRLMMMMKQFPKVFNGPRPVAFVLRYQLS